MACLQTIQHNLVDYIVLNDDKTFVMLAEGRFSKVYLFKLQCRNVGIPDIPDIPESYFALKVQRDTYKDLGNITNQHIDKTWMDEYQHLISLANISCIVQMKNILKYDGGGQLMRFSPLCYCDTRKKFFHLPCPDSGKPMEEYKIPNLKSVERFIYSPNQIMPSENSKTFVYANDDNPNSIAQIPDKCELCGKSKLLEKLSKSKLGSMQDTIPCVACQDYTADNFGSCPKFQVFSFYEFYAIPMELCHFPLIPFVQVLSQRKMEDIKNELSQEKWYFTNLFPTEECIFKFRENPDKRFLEVLYYKLTMFYDICVAVGYFHQKVKMAHMHLVPKNLMVRVFNDGLGGKSKVFVRPLQYGSFSITLIDVAGVSSYAPTGHDMIDPAVESKSLKFTVADIGKPFGVTCREGTISFQQGSFVLVSKDKDYNFKNENYQPGDWIVWQYQNSPMQYGKIEKVEAAMLKGEIGEPLQATQAKTPIFSETTVITIPSEHPTSQNIAVKFKHYPGYGPHYDLYGLGKLFAYLLFANSKVEIDAIEESIKKFQHHGLNADASVAEIENKIFADIKDTVFCWGNLVYEANNVLTQYSSIWKATIRLIFQIITTEFANFSISQEDIAGENLMKQISERVNTLKKEIEKLLYNESVTSCLPINSAPPKVASPSNVWQKMCRPFVFCWQYILKIFSSKEKSFYNFIANTGGDQVYHDKIRDMFFKALKNLKDVDKDSQQCIYDKNAVPEESYMTNEQYNTKRGIVFLPHTLLQSKPETVQALWQHAVAKVDEFLKQKPWWWKWNKSLVIVFYSYDAKEESYSLYTLSKDDKRNIDTNFKEILRKFKNNIDTYIEKFDDHSSLARFYEYVLQKKLGRF